jgi:uncharacterized protein YndB with AHSA1/START domain
MPARRTYRVDHQYGIRAPPGRVFRALTDPRWIRRWFADEAEVEPRKGGRYRFAWTGGPQHTGSIVEWVAGRKVTFDWSWEGYEAVGPTRLTYTVGRWGRGTLLTVVHTGIPRQDRWLDLYIGAEWGWTYFAMNLKSVVEGGRDLRSPKDG